MPDAYIQFALNAAAGYDFAKVNNVTMIHLYDYNFILSVSVCYIIKVVVLSINTGA